MQPFLPLPAAAELISASGTSASATLSPYESDFIMIAVIAAATGVRMHIRTSQGASTATTNDFCLPLVVGQTYQISKAREHDTVSMILNAGTATIAVTPGWVK